MFFCTSKLFVGGASWISAIVFVGVYLLYSLIVAILNTPTKSVNNALGAFSIIPTGLILLFGTPEACLGH